MRVCGSGGEYEEGFAGSEKARGGMGLCRDASELDEGTRGFCLPVLRKI